MIVAAVLLFIDDHYITYYSRSRSAKFVADIDASPISTLDDCRLPVGHQRPQVRDVRQQIGENVAVHGQEVEGLAAQLESQHSGGAQRARPAEAIGVALHGERTERTRTGRNKARAVPHRARRAATSAVRHCRRIGGG